MEWSEHDPRHTKFYFTLSYPNLHFPTNFHQNRTKIAQFGLVRKLSKGRFLTLRYKFGQKWYQTDRVDVSNQDVKKFVLHVTLGAAGAQKTA